MDDSLGVFCLVGIAAVTIFLMGQGCESQRRERDAIKHGHAHYAVTNATDKTASFIWNTNCSKP